MEYKDLYIQDIQRVLPNVVNKEQLFHKTLLITGGTGLIGSSVVDCLFQLNEEFDADIKIIIAARNKERMQKRFYKYKEGKDFLFLQYDSTKTDSIQLNEPIDYIIHGASNANPALYTKQPVETMMSNIIGLKVLLDLAKENSSCKLLYISSSEVYGQKEEVRPYNEDDYGYVDILTPRACYPSAKRVAETLCSAYKEEFGVDSVIVRPGHIYGPTISKTDDRASSQFTWNAVHHEDIVMKSAGAQLRSYCYCLDCASAILTVLLNGKSVESYNISNSNSIVSIREIAEQLAKAGNANVVFENPSDLEKKGYNLMSNSSLNSDKLESLGWKAEFSIDEGCKHTVEILK